MLLYGCYEGFEQPAEIPAKGTAKFIKNVVLYPNPISTGDKFSLFYELSDSSRVTILISNVAGDVIKKVADIEKHRIGKHDLQIESTNEDNQLLNSGIYLLYIKLESREERKIVFEIR